MLYAMNFPHKFKYKICEVSLVKNYTPLDSLNYKKKKQWPVGAEEDLLARDGGGQPDYGIKSIVTSVP